MEHCLYLLYAASAYKVVYANITKTQKVTLYYYNYYNNKLISKHCVC